MPSRLVSTITSGDPATRDRALDAICRELDLEGLQAECAALEAFWRECPNLYERVRALFFLYAIHRFHLPLDPRLRAAGRIPFGGYHHLLMRRFEEAIDYFLGVQAAEGPGEAISSALAAAYRALGFQTLADQVRRSVRTLRGNQWMFRTGHPADQALRVRPELLRQAFDGRRPLLRESTPVRMDLTHSGWSDIFFLGMDYPEGARVLNVSIDLGVRGRDREPLPPIETWLRVIDEPVLRLVSVDLGATAEIREISEVFDYARDYLGLLKAAVIAAGLVPPGLEGSDCTLDDLLARLVGPGLGLEVISHVRGIPKGSRLAVSTNLLASLIALCMRATGQARSLAGPLEEEERRVVAARAILGEWLAGSGGGWQDSGGLWPGMKRIEGVLAREGDPELGVSRGRLLPDHHILDSEEAPIHARQALQDSLVLVHGGMAQDVGPILEMVTEKYLLRSEGEWAARGRTLGVWREVLDSLREGDVRRLGQATTGNFTGPLQAIIPWASNLYTERLIACVRADFGDRFWGFWMLGGMSGGGMGFILDPRVRVEAQDRLAQRMAELKGELEYAMPFAMEPVVYDFSINERGSFADLLEEESALPADYFALRVPPLLRLDPMQLPPQTRAELDRFGAACRERPELRGMVQSLFDRLFPRPAGASGTDATLEELLSENGFDAEQHRQIQSDLQRGRIGLARNRLPADTAIEDVEPGDVLDATELAADRADRGREALERGEVAVVTLAAGSGSRWTAGAGVVKALNPFARLAGRHRTFLEVHLAKSRRAGRRFGAPVPHVVTTSYLTHDPIETWLARNERYGYEGPLRLSRGRSVGLRMVPMERDLRFAWEETATQLLDEQAQKVRESLQAALIGWARASGEGSDYRDNLPMQCLHPVGHWYEVPNLLLNGTLTRLVEERPELRTLLLHNVDTLGADVDPGLLGLHLERGGALSFEVVPRRVEDRGGGLARVNGRVRLVESLALPREEDEFDLGYYNSMSTWIDLDRLLELFGLSRADLADAERVAGAVRAMARHMPTYVTLKDVKKRWGHGQEDVFPIAQFEKLWSDMTALPRADCRFLAVSRFRGQQLKEPAQLDGWLRDGSAQYVESLCEWGP